MAADNDFLDVMENESSSISDKCSLEIKRLKFERDIELEKIKVAQEDKKFLKLYRNSCLVFFIMLVMAVGLSWYSIDLANKSNEVDGVVLKAFISNYEKGEVAVKVPFLSAASYAESIFKFKPGITPKTPLFIVFILFGSLLLYHFNIIKTLKSTSTPKEENIWASIIQTAGGLAALLTAWYLQSMMP